jgi:hypothetical protein
MTIQAVQDDNATQLQPVRSWLVSLVGFLLVAEAIFLIVLFPALILLRLWQLPNFSPSQLLPLQQTLQTFRLQLITSSVDLSIFRCDSLASQPVLLAWQTLWLDSGGTDPGRKSGDCPGDLLPV